MLKIFNELEELVTSVSEYEFAGADMSDSTVSCNVLLQDGVSFHPDWYVLHEGVRYKLGIRKPTGKKDTSSLDTQYSLVFHSPLRDFRRYPFGNYVEIGEGNPQPISYDVHLYCTITEFVARFNANLFGLNWEMVLPEDFVDDGKYYSVDFDNASLYDVLVKLYDIFSLRWSFQGNKIQFGFAPVEVEHIFEYGKNNGAVSVERNNETEMIVTRLRGRGSSKNLPEDYFHNGDPDTNATLQTVFFPNLLPSNYRDYVRGYNERQESESESWAYNQGVKDAVGGKPMAPVDYALSDKEELWGVSYRTISPNEEIFPTLQGVESESLGRLDEVVAVEDVLSDKPLDEENTGTTYTIKPVTGYVSGRDGNKQGDAIPDCSTPERKVIHEDVCYIGKPVEKDLNRLEFKFSLNGVFYDSYGNIEGNYGIFDYSARVLLENDKTGDVLGEQRWLSGTQDVIFNDVPRGEYRLRCVIELYSRGEESMSVCSLDYAMYGSLREFDYDYQRYGFKSTFNVWIKDIWGIPMEDGETESEYIYRVWGPLVAQNDMTVMFSDGMLAGEDYEFRVVGVSGSNKDEDLKSKLYAAIRVDTSHSLDGVYSKWRITLEKSDAELSASDMYLPNSSVKAKAGDHFYFIGIKMPYNPYVFSAEKRVQDWLDEELAKLDEEFPSVTITPSRIFCAYFNESHKLVPGAKIRVRNKSLIGDSYVSLYIQSVTKRYSKDRMNPDWSLTLSDEVVPIGNPVSILSGQVEKLGSQVYSSKEAIKEAIRLMESVFLRKDGLSDTSYSPTKFDKKVEFGNDGLSDDSFVQGDVSGQGFGVYTDANGNRVLEADVLVGRIGARFNEVQINQTTFVGGKQIFSSAGMIVSRVEGLTCYFDTKRGSVRNSFKVNDGAYSQHFSDAGPITYWMRVIEVGPDYIVLDENAGILGTPKVGDNIAQLGSSTDKSRQSAFIIDEVRDGGGLVSWYDDIDGFTLSGKNSVDIGRLDGKTWIRVYGSSYTGTRDKSQYISYEDGVVRVKGKIAVGSEIGEGLTVVEDGLVQSRLVRLGQVVDGIFQTWAGTSGEYDRNKRGGGIASWFGGDKIDLWDYIDEETGELRYPLDVRYAKGVDRMDGTGYRANGKLWWDAEGNVHADPLSFFVGEDKVEHILRMFYPIIADGVLKAIRQNVPFESVTIGDARLEYSDGALRIVKADGSAMNLVVSGDASAFGTDENGGEEDSDGVGNLIVGDWVDGLDIKKPNEQYIYLGNVYMAKKSGVLNKPSPMNTDEWYLVQGNPTPIVEITSTNGVGLDENELFTTLVAKLTWANQDLTYSIPFEQWNWERVSDDSEGDAIWNSQHIGVGNEITLSEDDLLQIQNGVKFKVNVTLSHESWYSAIGEMMFDGDGNNVLVKQDGDSTAYYSKFKGREIDELLDLIYNNKITYLTESEYEALEFKDDTKLYYIMED